MISRWWCFDTRESMSIEQPGLPSDDDGLIVQLRLPMRANLLPTVRRLVFETAHSAFHNIDLSSRLSLTVHELLENALKYSSDPRKLTTLRIAAAAQRQVRVTVMSAAPDAAVAPLRELLEQLNSEPDRRAAFQRLIHHSLQRETGSGLGLARISSEGEMDLSCELSRGI